MRRSIAPGGVLVVKIGSSSLVEVEKGLDPAALERVVGHVTRALDSGYPTVLVTSGAVAAGLPALGLTDRPTDLAGLQVAAAVGQGRLMGMYAARFARRGLVAGQVLLTRGVLASRTPYLNARTALSSMLERRIVPVVNENDTVGVEELRVGDNDRLAALVSHLVSADLLILLTDTPGLYSADPSSPDARLISEISSGDWTLDSIASLPGGRLGSGGVSSKVAAARMAAFSGIPTVVAPSSEPRVVERVCRGEDIGTWVNPEARKLSARKLWIAFGLESGGRVTLDAGAVRAITRLKKSLLPVGVREIEGSFTAGEAVEVVDPQGRSIAKGIARISASDCRRLRASTEPTTELIHRDDLVVLRE